MADNKIAGDFSNHHGTQYQDPEANKFTRSDDARDADSPHPTDRKAHHGKGKGPHQEEAKLSKKEKQKIMQRGLVPSLAGCALAVVFMFSCAGKIEAAGLKGTGIPKVGTAITAKACTNVCDTLKSTFDADWTKDNGFASQWYDDVKWAKDNGFAGQKYDDVKWAKDNGFAGQKYDDLKWAKDNGFASPKYDDAKWEDGYGFQNQKAFDAKWKDGLVFKQTGAFKLNTLK
jgi:hypothetical protein